MGDIPKVVHYCWFGKEPPKQVVEQVQQWQEVLVDYTVIMWNESNTDLESHPYIREAYNLGKYAFVSDLVRLHVLEKYGGVYLDTDVEIIKPFDDLLGCEAFIGLEDAVHLSTAVIGSKKKAKWISAMIASYEGVSFVRPDGTHDETTNVTRLTRRTRELLGLTDGVRPGSFGVVEIYPPQMFSAKDHRTGIVATTEETYAVHHFAGSWLSEEQRRRKSSDWGLVRRFGSRVGVPLMMARRVVREDGTASALAWMLTRLRTKLSLKRPSIEKRGSAS